MAGYRAKAKAAKEPQASDGPKADAAFALDAEAADAADRYARLTAARAATEEVVNAHLSAERDSLWPVYLRDTAGHIVDVLSDLALDASFWTGLHTAEQALGMATSEQRAMVSEILESDLTGLLDLMGYAPPPPTEEIGRETQIALFDAVEEPDAALRGQTTQQAAHQMLVYVYRLRALIAAVDEADTSHADHLGLRLLSMARTGARAIVPATIAAGAVAVLFPAAAATGAAAAGGAVLTAGMTAATKEATKQGIQLASAGMMAAALGDQDGKVSRETAFEATEQTFFRVASEVRVVAEYLLTEQPPEPAPLISAYVIEAIRWSFQLERARSAMSQTARLDPSQLAAKAVMSALTDLRDWIQFAPDYAGMEDIRDRLDVALQGLAGCVSSVI